jgi:hypothetical protein
VRAAVNTLVGFFKPAFSNAVKAAAHEHRTSLRVRSQLSGKPPVRTAGAETKLHSHIV